MATTLDRGRIAAPAGLSEHDANDRHARGMGNTAPPATGRTYGQIVSEHVFTLINLCLFGLGGALILLGRPLDALIACGVVALNILVSVAQEVRAKRTLDRIALLTRPTATVVRAGRPRPAAPEELVVGDLLLLAAGDQIVVDGALTEGRLQVDESLLSGESRPVQKRAGDQLFAGSFVVSGGGAYTAERLGAQSLAGQITAGARAFRRVLTPLQARIAWVIRVVLLFVLYIEALVAAHGLLRPVPLAESVQRATLVAGLVPNGLFVAIALTYALAALRIIRFGALVQQANAVESLARVDVICLDKTGTLTANRLQLDALRPIDPALSAAELGQLIGRFAASAGDAGPTIAALAAALPAAPEPALTEVPFASARKWSALAFADGIYALGAPELLRPYTDDDIAMADDLAARGLRVLLLCHHPDPALLADQGDDSRLPHGMRALGLAALRDELRPEAQTTLAAFLRAGVQPKIISGDSPHTVAALARQAGLAVGQVVSGIELEGLDDAAFAARAAEATIFGRITPQQKERLVRALRARGRYVAMVGDGVNDVLALKQANLGVAMQSGSQAARGVADIVLLNDSFAALVPAVAEGQRIINGMHDILRLFLTRIATVGLLVLSALALGTFPLELREGSLLTLLSVGIPSLVLPFWSRPGPQARPGLRHFVLAPALASSALGLLLFYGAGAALSLTLGPPSDAALAVARTALTSFLVCCGLLLVVFVEPPTPWWAVGDELSGDWRPTILAGSLLAAFAALLATPALRAIFGLAALPPIALGLVAIALGAWIIVVHWLWRTNLLDRALGAREPR